MNKKIRESKKKVRVSPTEFPLPSMAVASVPSINSSSIHYQTFIITSRTPRRASHIKQNIQHIQFAHIRPHSRLIDIRTPLIKQRIKRQSQPILLEPGASVPPTNTQSVLTLRLPTAAVAVPVLDEARR